MGAPLYDISIYYYGNVIKDAPEDLDFRLTVNYISDFYHNGLNGYKPPKTGRICISLSSEKVVTKPSYFGSICSHDNIIDENKYLALPKEGKYKYILDLLHSAILEIAEFYDWDKSIFNKSYEHIINNGFTFEKHYPVKKSRDRTTLGQIILTKTEEKSSLSVLISKGTDTINTMLFEKRNEFWYDSIYSLAKMGKWIDKTSFGFVLDGKKCYYSTTNDKIYDEITFGENDFKK